MRDPKLGYHWLWILPLYYLSLLAELPRKLRKTWKNMTLTKEQKRLQKIAGIRK